MIGIYKIENLINHKKYIGKANNINKRFGEHKRIAFYKSDPSYNYPLYKAIRKYGINNFDFSIIEECKEDELEAKEKYWIKFFNTYEGEGYNQTPGGDGVPKVLHSTAIKLYNQGHSIEEISDYFHAAESTIRNILHLYNLGYLSQEEKDKLQKPRAVSQYDLNGKFIQDFYSAGNAAKQLGYKTKVPILKACNEGVTAYHYLWKYKDDDKDMEYLAKEIIQKEKNRVQNVIKAIKKSCSKQVNQYDLQGNYIQTFESTAEAGRSLGKGHGHIAEVCRGVWPKAYNFIWRYVSEEFPINKNLTNVGSE